jgi:hypothetical protein
LNFATLFQPVADGVQAAITAVLPIAIPVLVTLSGVTIAIGVFRKFGVRR